MLNYKYKLKVNLVHPYKNVNQKYKIFKEIELIDNLKYVLIKSKSKNAFDIPPSMTKYEVGNMIEKNEDIN